jgi:hypothetical protein
MGDATCSISGCDKKRYGHGWCNMHWSRWRRHGDPETPSNQGLEPMTRFLSKVNVDGPCWEWVGQLNAQGYGVFSFRRKDESAHRWLYQQLVATVPDGLELDHLCRNRACVNPDHLEPVTHKVNVLRGSGVAAEHARKTRCIRNHELAGSNLRIRIKAGRYVERVCRQCFNDRRKERAANGAKVR